MPAATQKSNLLAITQREFAKLTRLIATVPQNQALSQDTEGVAIKDIVGHRAHWIEMFLGWYTQGISGQTVHMPAKGYKWSALKQHNAKIRKQQAGLNWNDVQTLLLQNHSRLISFIEGHSDQDLYGTLMIGHDKWTTGRFAEAAGASHYRSAAKYIRDRLKADVTKATQV